MLTCFTFVRVSEELLPGKACFDDKIRWQIAKHLGGGSYQAIVHGEVRGGEAVDWPTHEECVTKAMLDSGAELVELQGEEFDSGSASPDDPTAKWIKIFRKDSKIDVLVVNQ